MLVITISSNLCTIVHHHLIIIIITVILIIVILIISIWESILCFLNVQEFLHLLPPAAELGLNFCPHLFYIFSLFLKHIVDFSLEVQTFDVLPPTAELKILVKQTYKHPRIAIHIVSCVSLGIFVSAIKRLFLKYIYLPPPPHG